MPNAEFYRTHKEYYRRKHREYAQSHKKELYLKNRHFYLAYAKTPKGKAYRRDYMRNVRLAAIKAYGGKCACCQTDTIEFLGIDHIAGKGNEHRKEIRKLGLTMHLWLRVNNYPEGFRILCHNCNLSKGFYGYCPHQKSMEVV